MSHDESDDSDYLNHNLLEELDLPPVYASTESRSPQVRAASVREDAPSERVGRPRPAPLPPQQQPRAAPVPNVEEPAPGRVNLPVRPPVVAPPRPKNRRLVIALDYGTTFTGLAFTYVDSTQAELETIQVLQNWTQRMSNQQKVPSRIAFVANGVEWGSDIGDQSTTNLHTKLELEEQETRLDELELTLHVLDRTGSLGFQTMKRLGPNPPYISKAPQEIVTDYLTKICECVVPVVNVEQLKTTKTPVDIVITVPVDWSYEAVNATFKAIRGAGFNRTTFPTLKDTILISEPEAASYYTARALGENHFLEAADCFVLADAGGGTVDLVSFQVEKTSPFLQIRKITEPTNGKNGSAWIDTAFKKWLRDILGVELYRQLDPINAKQPRISPHTAEQGPIRQLIKSFEAKKMLFSNSSPAEIRLDLPAPLDGLTIEGRVREGELTIRWSEMAAFFDECVNGVVGMVQSQIDKVVDSKKRRVKNLFLVGGFGASPYLREKLKESLDFRKVKLRRPDEDQSWTAVVKGAVVYGVEKTYHPDATYISGFSKSYGVLLPDGRLEWLVRKGDMIRSNRPTPIYSSKFWIPASKMIDGAYDTSIFSYKHRDDDDVPDQWASGQHEVNRETIVKCNFSRYIAKPIPYNATIGPVRWMIQASGHTMNVEVQLIRDIPWQAPEKVVGTATLKVEVEQSNRGSVSVQDGQYDQF